MLDGTLNPKQIGASTLGEKITAPHVATPASNALSEYTIAGFSLLLKSKVLGGACKKNHDNSRREHFNIESIAKSLALDSALIDSCLMAGAIGRPAH